jgi:hypothetical protein
MMYLDHEAVNSDGNSGPAERDNLVPASGGVTRVDNDRQVAFLLHHEDGRQIQGIAAVVGEGADPAFTQDYI